MDTDNAIRLSQILKGSKRCEHTVEASAIGVIADLHLYYHTPKGSDGVSNSEVYVSTLR